MWCTKPSKSHSPINPVVPFLHLAGGRAPLGLIIILVTHFLYVQNRILSIKIRRSAPLLCLRKCLLETGTAVFLKNSIVLWLFFLQIRHPWGCQGRFSSLPSHVFSVVTQVKPQDDLWCVITISSFLTTRALTPDSWDTGPYRCGLEHILSELLELLGYLLHSWNTAPLGQERFFFLMLLGLDSPLIHCLSLSIFPGHYCLWAGVWQWWAQYKLLPPGWHTLDFIWTFK